MPRDSTLAEHFADLEQWDNESPAVALTEPTLVDHGADAAAALAGIETATPNQRAAVKITRQCWSKYGDALARQRVLMPSNKEFHKWIRERRLDTGLARLASVRSDAMWLARNAVVLEQFEVTVAHPTRLRALARSAGYLFANDESAADGQPKPTSTYKKKPSEPTSSSRSRKKPLLEVPADELKRIPAELHDRYRQMREAQHAAQRATEDADRQRESFKRKQRGLEGLRDWLCKREATTVLSVIAASTHEDQSEALEVFGRVLPLLED
jgi:hypothetical protein